MKAEKYVEFWKNVDIYVSRRDFPGLFAWCLYSYVENPQVAREARAGIPEIEL